MDRLEKDEDSAISEDDIYNIVIDCSSLFESFSIPLLALGSDSTIDDVAPKNHDQQDNLLGGDTDEELQRQRQYGKDISLKKVKLESLRKSFELWISYTGALAAVGRSLDDRLREHGDIKEMVMELLQMLYRNLQYICNNIQQFDQNSTVVIDQSVEEEAWAAIEQAIDDLQFMAAAIRRASVQSQSYNLSSRFERDDELYFQETIILLVRRQFPDARRSLCEHIGASIAIRRKRLFRRKAHEEKLGRKREVVPQGPKFLKRGVNPGAQSQLSPSQADASRASLAIQRIKRANHIQMGSDDSRSRIESVAARRYIQAGPALSTISSGSSVRDPTLEYPPKPKPAPEDKHCACPFCAKPLEAEKLKKDTKYWEDHIDNDVKPYVCLSEDCTSPFVFFVHMSQWLDHMNTIHSKQWNRTIHMTTWYCDIDHEGQDLQFNDHRDYIAHMKDEKSHSSRRPPTDAQLESLSRKKQQVLVREDQYACPLCDCVPASILPVVQASSPGDLKALLDKHIAKHVKTLAFLSVPAVVNPDIDQGEATGSNEYDKGKRRRRRTGSEISWPSGFDDEIRAIDLSFVEPTISSFKSSEPVQDIFYNMPEASETEWDDIGYIDYKKAGTGILSSEEDSVIRHFSKIKSSIYQDDSVDNHPVPDKSAQTDEEPQNIPYQSPVFDLDRKSSWGSGMNNSVSYPNHSNDDKPAQDDESRQQVSALASGSISSETKNVVGTASEHTEMDLPSTAEPTEQPQSSAFSRLLNRFSQPESYKKKSKYVFGKILGAGSESVIREAEILNESKFAVKVILKKTVRGKEQEVFEAIRIMESLDHPHIIKLVEWFESREKYYIVTQLATGGELFDRICDLGKFTEKDTVSTTKQILEAINYLHSRHIIHRNVKPEKLLYLDQNPDSKLMLGGLGTCMQFDGPDGAATEPMGSFGYAAPEIMSKENYSKPADMWSIGVTTYTLLCGYSPFRSETLEELILECKSGRIIFHERYWKDVSEAAKSFILGLLNPDPKKRLTSYEALEHPWITSGGIEPPLSMEEKAARARSRLQRGIQIVMLANRIEYLKMMLDEADEANEAEVRKYVYSSILQEVAFAKMRLG